MDEIIALSISIISCARSLDTNSDVGLSCFISYAGHATGGTRIPEIGVKIGQNCPSIRQYLQLVFWYLGHRVIYTLWSRHTGEISFFCIRGAFLCARVHMSQISSVDLLKIFRVFRRKMRRVELSSGCIFVSLFVVCRYF